ncbi:MAG: UDP-N-acetylmuramoyl-L-alanine--D-glutamate ligase, partial [Bacteroidota bacterium]
ESGVGAAVLAKKNGFEVFVSDSGKIKVQYKKVLSHNEIMYEEGKHTARLILNADEVVKSPGIPEKAEMIKEVRKKKIPIISEIEFAARYTNATLIGITGTNGKTTTTSLIYHILKRAAYNVKMAGNIGKSFAMMVAEECGVRSVEFGGRRKTPNSELPPPDYYVLELSSFQLDGMFKTRINIAILTNITPDHLDSYKNKVQNYINSKLRITQNQTNADSFIYCADDKVTAKEIIKRKLNAQLFPFSIKRKMKRGAHLLKENILSLREKTKTPFRTGGKMILNINQHNQFTMFVEQLALQGKHNIYNSMAAGIAARVVDVRKNVIRESLSDFQNIEHRMEFVSKVHGVNYINDSKATNVNSAWYALESMTHPIVWIVGGVDKGNDYKMLHELVKQKVKAIVCLGVDNKKIKRSFSKLVDTIVQTSSASDAVRAASRLASKGDTILLSPCCASQDLFDNYEDRGRKFKQAVKSL